MIDSIRLLLGLSLFRRSCWRPMLNKRRPSVRVEAHAVHLGFSAPSMLSPSTFEARGLLVHLISRPPELPTRGGSFLVMASRAMH